MKIKLNLKPKFGFKSHFNSKRKALALSVFFVGIHAFGLVATDLKFNPGVFELKSPVLDVFGRSDSGMPGKYLSEDSDFKYYRSGNGLYRLFKNPAPRLSHESAQKIPQAPSLYWPGHFEFIGDDTAPAKPNCTEADFSIQVLV